MRWTAPLLPILDTTAVLEVPFVPTPADAAADALRWIRLGPHDTFIDLFGDITRDEGGGPSRSTRAMGRAHVDATRCTGLKDVISTVQVMPC